jgi:hypothetical protein
MHKLRQNEQVYENPLAYSKIQVHYIMRYIGLQISSIKRHVLYRADEIFVIFAEWWLFTLKLRISTACKANLKTKFRNRAALSMLLQFRRATSYLPTSIFQSVLQPLSRQEVHTAARTLVQSDTIHVIVSRKNLLCFCCNQTSSAFIHNCPALQI